MSQDNQGTRRPGIEVSGDQLSVSADLEPLGRYAAVPDDLLHDARLSARAKHLWGVLRRFAWRGNTAMPWRRTIANRMAERELVADQRTGEKARTGPLKPVSLDTVDRALGELVRVGWVKVTPRFDGAVQRSNLYELTRPTVIDSTRVLDPEPSANGVAADLRPPRRKDAAPPAADMRPPSRKDAAQNDEGRNEQVVEGRGLSLEEQVAEILERYRKSPTALGRAPLTMRGPRGGLDVLAFPGQRGTTRPKVTRFQVIAKLIEGFGFEVICRLAVEWVHHTWLNGTDAKRPEDPPGETFHHVFDAARIDEVLKAGDKARAADERRAESEARQQAETDRLRAEADERAREPRSTVPDEMRERFRRPGAA